MTKSLGCRLPTAGHVCVRRATSHAAVATPRTHPCAQKRAQCTAAAAARAGIGAAGTERRLSVGVRAEWIDSEKGLLIGLTALHHRVVGLDGGEALEGLARELDARIIGNVPGERKHAHAAVLDLSLAQPVVVVGGGQVQRVVDGAFDRVLANPEGVREGEDRVRALRPH